MDEVIRWIEISSAVCGALAGILALALLIRVMIWMVKCQLRWRREERQFAELVSRGFKPARKVQKQATM